MTGTSSCLNHYTLVALATSPSRVRSSELLRKTPSTAQSTSWGLAAPSRQVGAVVIGVVHDGYGRVDAQDSSRGCAEGEDGIPDVPEQLLLETVGSR